MKVLKSVKYFLAIASVGLIAGTASAQEKVNTATELTRAVKLCFDLAATGKDEFAALSADGYRIKKRKLRKQTAYKKGVSAELFGAPGIIIHKSQNGCKINAFGISHSNANNIFKRFQASIEAAGYQRVGRLRFKKGDVIIGLQGSFRPTIIKIFRGS